MSSYENQLDPIPLLHALIDKTQAGKLKWDETADENIFLVSVGGNTTLKVRRLFNSLGDDFHYLSLLDENGKLIWEINQPSGLIEQLFVLARRVALKVDERVEALMGTLQRL